ncbi:hypothetical protein C1645_828924 [Glomus cerebriforme]|uniref:Uncharacterized protein n=1 Tax=Glomus cerebriforme TaxID=658196 RepID=A0A397SRP4_9GLOM|nr:hypothetical protein C1645_828924 [Glomus cerebriforme]
MVFSQILQSMMDSIRIGSQQMQNIQQAVAPQPLPNAQVEQQSLQMDRLQTFNQPLNHLQEVPAEGAKGKVPDISWPNPMEINFIRKIIPNDVATITYQITSPSGKSIQVPGALIVGGANCSLKSKGLVKLLGTDVDKNKKPPVKWRNNSLESIGTCYNISITFGYGDNSCTITEDFPVIMDDDKPWILLGTLLLDRAGWEPIVKREFKLLHKAFGRKNFPANEFSGNFPRKFSQQSVEKISWQTNFQVTSQEKNMVPIRLSLA